ncbi:Rv3654c family TadE-like protein [Nocardia sp. 004]|uniref:Rv3654c family TadE-like protein n=1 Tax=Nocardia sp. 004 TaxID=3385978 RepID=UPI00399F747B
MSAGTRLRCVSGPGRRTACRRRVVRAWSERQIRARAWCRTQHSRFAVAIRRVSGEAGVATVFTCLGLVALLSVTVVIAQVGVVIVARHRAQAAADMAALAGAGTLVDGTEIACAEAEDVARRMGARIQNCEVTEWDMTITTERNVPIGLYGDRIVRAIARAGPVVE